MGLFDSIGSFTGGTVGSLFGGVSKGVGDGAAQNGFTATTQNLGDLERQKYAEKILASQKAADDSSYQNMLMNQMQGIGPSVADMSQRKYAEDATQHALALAHSARGDINPALLQKQAMNAGMAAQAQGAQNAGVMKAQEQLNAQNLFSQNRGQNLGMQQFYENLGMQGDLANQGGANSAQNLNAGISTNNMQSKNQFTGGVMSGAGQAGAMMAMSDEGQKKDIASADAEIRSFLDALSAHKYKYKNPGADGGGEHFSPMAQELEKTPVGHSMVLDTPRGKMVDYGKGFGAVLAAQSYLNERLNALENKKHG